MDGLQAPVSTTVVTTEPELRSAVDSARSAGQRVGLVPTMGALHAGHLSLIEAARENCDFLVVSIFVNPTQFGPNEDLTRYPRPFEADLAACGESGVDLVFQPDVETMYPSGFATWITVDGISDRLEGAFRPGHFRGVATVVMKLLQLVQPDVSFFGRKDYQQQLLIRRMCADLGVRGEIVTCPTVRDPDGLAVSSRNQYLSDDERKAALALHQSLQQASRALKSGETDVESVRGAMREQLEATPGVRLDYFTIADTHSLDELAKPQPEMIALVAAHVGTTRLIDNLPISC